MIIAFLQGLNDFNILIMFYYYKERLNFSVVKLQFIQAMVMIPWLIKPVFGFLSDNFPIAGTRRRSYLMIVCVVEMIIYLLVSFMPAMQTLVMAINMVMISCIVFKNILAEGMVVELTKQAQLEFSATQKFVGSKGRALGVI